MTVKRRKPRIPLGLPEPGDLYHWPGVGAVLVVGIESVPEFGWGYDWKVLFLHSDGRVSGTYFTSEVKTWERLGYIKKTET